ncbi:hypothetical protein GCM10023196_024230 [Actinoallomurus vinaceus]|uniref:Outer membrane channel protein CpnT-like N-terminal domain-containing protein n=1 Tax=Actinoallomurus vinaceus TaxID=1080074 RepID=A0ABP8U5G5_9ACTN
MTSDSVRFSVEVLVYYAPRFAEAGAALSRAGTTAQRRLEGLGSFWGSSWPDEAFAESYRPAQHSLLITAQQCAGDLRQIAGRIHQMAHNYGVTEANVTADIDRIGQAASQEARLLHGTGGLPPPPDVPERTPPPLPRTTPNPTSNPSPNPPAPAQRPKSTRTASPTPTPTPEASPDPNAWKKSGATSFLGPFPTGKPELIEQAAEAWRDLATALRTAWMDTQHYAAYVLAENEGHAADAFAAQVRQLVDSTSGSLTLTLQGCEHTERACWDQAQAIRDLKHQFVELAAEFALTFVIGEIISAILAAPTLGGSEAAGQAAEAAEAGGITARATALLRQFIAAVVARMKAVGTALKDLARVLPKAEREASGLAKSTEAAGRRLLGDGKTPIKELDPQERTELAQYRDNLAQENPSLYDSLLKDPDHLRRDGSYAIDDGAHEEAKTALSLREDGRVPADFQRPPGRGQGDFYSPSTGKYYDVKEVTSSSNFRVNNFENKLEAQFALSRTPIIDTRNASQATIDQIKSMIARRGWGNDVIWYP